MICEFNSHHHVPKKEYREHLKTCAENLATQKAVQTLHTANVKISGISDIMSGVHLVGGGDDDWDDDNYAAYDPTSKMAETPMILPQGLTPAERRDYRIAKRQGEHHERLGLDRRPSIPKEPPKSGISDIMSGVDKVLGNGDDDWEDDSDPQPVAPKVVQKAPPKVVERPPPMIKAPESAPVRVVQKDQWIPTEKPKPKPKATPKAAPKPAPAKGPVVNKFAMLSIDDDGLPKTSKKGGKKKKK